MIRKLFLNDKFILGLIIVNAIFLFVAGYLTKENHTLIFLYADNIITTLFIAELIVKSNEYGFKNYFKSGWNKLDFALIIVSIPSLISFVFNIQIFDVSFLLVFRILRVFKAFRFFKFIPNVGELVKGVQRALKTSVFIIIGFAIYIFIIGILSFYLFQNSQTEFFSTPTISLYSTFKIFTIEGWFEIPEMISANYSESATFFIYLYFIFVVVTGGIIGLSLVNSIFVDSMVSDNNDDIEQKINNLDDKLNDIIKKLDNHET
ncbi:MAG: ion transporter [Prolixibacteraceae bacterium]|nr:ion transporter [Prolixibacteraceae bacterium]